MRRVYKFTNIAVILAMILQILSGTIILAQDTTEEGFSEQTTEPTQIVLPEVEPTDSEGFNPETLLPAPLETEIPASATEEAEPINTETPVPEPTVEPTPIPSIEPTEVPRDPAEYEGIEATELSKTEFWETHFDIHKNSDFAELYFALQLRDTGLKFENDIYTYAYYVSVYKPTPDNLSYLQDLIIQGADVRLIFDLYVFWLDISKLSNNIQ